MEKIKQNPIVKKIGINRIVLCGVLILMYAIFCMLSSKFVGVQRIMSALNYAYFLGFLSLGVTFVIATGGIDFSIGPVMFCSALISGYCLTKYGVPLVLSLLISVLVGFLFGVFNGYFVAYWTVPPFIISMASMNIAKGLASVFTKTQSVSWPQSVDANGWDRNHRAADGSKAAGHRSSAHYTAGNGLIIILIAIPGLNGGVRRYIENSRNANQCAAYDICQHFPFLYINAGKPYRLFIASKAQYVTTCLHLV